MRCLPSALARNVFALQLLLLHRAAWWSCNLADARGALEVRNHTPTHPCTHSPPCPPHVPQDNERKQRNQPKETAEELAEAEAVFADF